MGTLDLINRATIDYIRKTMDAQYMMAEDDTDPFGDWVAEVRREQEELDGINGS